MVDESRFKIKLGELDGSTRTCILFLRDEINRLRVKKTDIHPDVFKGLMQHEKEIKQLAKINNLIVETLDALEKHYENTLGLPEKIGKIIMGDVEKNIDENRKILDENIKKVNEEFRRIQAIRDDIIRIVKIVARRMNIEFSLMA